MAKCVCVGSLRVFLVWQTCRCRWQRWPKEPSHADPSCCKNIAEENSRKTQRIFKTSNSDCLCPSGISMLCAARPPVIHQESGRLFASGFCHVKVSHPRPAPELIAYAIRPATLCSFLEQRRSVAQGLDYSPGNLIQLSRPNPNIRVCAATAIRLVVSV
jgi:hypothetical protein